MSPERISFQCMACSQDTGCPPQPALAEAGAGCGGRGVIPAQAGIQEPYTQLQAALILTANARMHASTRGERKISVATTNEMHLGFRACRISFAGFIQYTLVHAVVTAWMWQPTIPSVSGFRPALDPLSLR